ncbi:helix-turn-helix domain-containing protein [Sphaerotilus sp.]|uniref:helix-turn-helix domain-containing protein n=1 Tax=Sphaerotilus sp. TaxID=2093942 RepID=UPI002ACE7D6E|nr:helix-turn-helix domain-containing protein [Sphaerotilus sp.]MDZ7857353.1 helix-turn-helix domain-containing protein [Sphaerotilus sp.]
MGQEYSSLSLEERTQLGLLVTQKLTQRQIAVQLGRSASTISRELARNRHPKRGYLVATAQQQAARRRVQAKAGVRKLGQQFDTPLGKWVRHELERALSPEQIAGRLKLMNPEDTTQRVSHETIYRTYSAPRH